VSLLSAYSKEAPASSTLMTATRAGTTHSGLAVASGQKRTSPHQLQVSWIKLKFSLIVLLVCERGMAK
jgi:hypothetical protein